MTTKVLSVLCNPLNLNNDLTFTENIQFVPQSKRSLPQLLKQCGVDYFQGNNVRLF